MAQSEVQLILARRLALGEISEEQYDLMLARITGDDDRQPNTNPNREAHPAPPGREQGIGNYQAANRPASPSGRRNFVSRFWRGEVSLIATFWGGIVAEIMIRLVVVSQMRVLQNTRVAALLVAGVLAFDIFLAVAMYRSGQAYRWRGRPKLWGRIAQLMSLVLVAWGTLFMIVVLRPVFSRAG